MNLIRLHILIQLQEFKQFVKKDNSLELDPQVQKQAQEIHLMILNYLLLHPDDIIII